MDLITSIFSASLAVVITYPIDVIKTQFQVTLKGSESRSNLFTLKGSESHSNLFTRLKHKNPKGANVTSLTKDLYQQRGLYGFYRGVGSSLMTYPIFWGLYFQTKKIKWEPTNYKYGDKFIIASGSGIVASIITNPLFVIKTRFQTDNLKTHSNSPIKKSYTNLIKSIYHHEGIGGYYKGLLPTLLNNTKLGVQFPLYDYLKEQTDSVLISSGLAKTLASTIFYPLDLIRVNQRDLVEKLSIRDAVKQIYKKSGPIGFYRGVMLYNFVNGSGFVLMMLIKDKLDRLVEE